MQYPGVLPPAVGGLIRAVLADRYLAGAVTHPETVLACGLSEEGAIVSTTDPVAALRRWLDLAQPRTADMPLFGPVAWSGERSRSNALSGRDVARILQSRGAAAGLGDLPISGHSLRAGHATEAAARGVPADRLARTTRHKSAAALARYVRPAEVLSDTSSSDLGL